MQNLVASLGILRCMFFKTGSLLKNITPIKETLNTLKDIVIDCL